MLGHSRSHFSRAFAWWAWPCNWKRVLLGNEGAFYLLSNWRNLSGRDPLTKSTLWDSAALPDPVRFLAYEKGENKPDGNLYQINDHQIALPLFAVYSSQSLWFEHSSRSSDEGDLTSMLWSYRYDYYWAKSGIAWKTHWIDEIISGVKGHL